MERDKDRPQEACGMSSMLAPDEPIARLAYFSLFALQLRGKLLDQIVLF